MKRPYIVCHMIASIDGRIDCDMVDRISGDEYYDALNKLNCPHRLEGRVTAAHYYAAAEPFCLPDDVPVGCTDFFKAPGSEHYDIIVDTRGTLRWPDDDNTSGSRLCIVSTQAGRAYLQYLKDKGISYIAVGETQIDLLRAMDILYNKFGVKRLLLLGGGNINGGFLQEGLIDEISLMIAPGVDGRAGQTAVFDGIRAPLHAPVAFKPERIDTYDNGTIWIRYIKAV